MEAMPQRIVIRARVFLAPILKKEIARHLEEEIADEEDARPETVNRLAEIEVGQHRQLREADVHPVDPGEDKQKDQEADQPHGRAPVAFLQEGSVPSRRIVCHRISLSKGTQKCSLAGASSGACVLTSGLRHSRDPARS